MIHPELLRPINNKLTLFSLVCLCVGLLITVRLAYMQISRVHHFASQGEKNFLRTESIACPRGNIRDCNGILLATNRPITNIAWCGTGNSVFSAQQYGTLATLETILETPIISDIHHMRALAHRERYYKEIPIATDISFEQLSQIEERFPNNPNIHIFTHFQRHYPHGTYASHILGYLGTHIDTEPFGQMGLEKIGDDALKGQKGTMLNTINAVGRKIAQEELSQARSGKDIYTTLNSKLQRLCETIFPPEAVGTMIMMDPHTGAILSVLSRPTFDPTVFLTPISHDDWQTLSEKKPFLNRACNACYPPGSVFKLVTVAAALEEGVASIDDIWHCKGYVFCGKRKQWCSRRYGHGDLTTREAIALSCNTLFFEVGKLIDVDTLATYAHKFGLGVPTGICFPEKNGLVPTRQWKYETKGERWWPGETLSITIGQSFLLSTPLQVTRMIAAIHTGFLVTPRLLAHEPITTEPLGISEHTRTFLKKSMKSVVKQGTGRRLRTVSDIKMYAKTSTAQTSLFHKRNLGKQYKEHGWFSGTFQYKEYDPITVVILVENAGTAQVATTVAKNMLIAYKKLMDVT